MTKSRPGPSFSVVNKGRLELLNNDPKIFAAFIADITKAADIKRSGTVKDTRIQIRKALEFKYRTEKKVDIKSLRRAFDLVEDKRGLKEDPRIKAFEEEVVARERAYVAEHQLFSCIITILELDRLALAEILDIRGINKNPEAIPTVIEIYELAQHLLFKLLELKASDLSLPTKVANRHDTLFVKAPFQHLDLSEFGSLVMWLKEYIHHEISLSERHIADAYRKERNQNPWKTMLKILDDQLQKAILLINTLLKRTRLELPAPDKEKDSFSTIEIARTRMEHLSVLFCLLLTWINNNPGRAIGTEIHDLVERYRENERQNK